MLKRAANLLSRWVLRAAAILIMVVCVSVAASGAYALVQPQVPMRGALVDIGGRNLRLVCEGPEGPSPLVVFEAGIYGFSADFGELQRRLAAEGYRSCAYDRAGLGYSDPDPADRDGVRVVSDLERLLDAAGERGRLVLVAHSMGGVHARLFVGRNPDRVKGFVLLDAMSPAASADARTRRSIGGFTHLARVVEVVTRLGLTKPLTPFMGDRIGLTGAARAEKRAFFANAAHSAAAGREIGFALKAIDQAAASPAVPPDVIIAVVTAGPPRQAPVRPGNERRSHPITVEAVPEASHASLLGRDGAELVTRTIVRVLQAATGAE